MGRSADYRALPKRAPVWHALNLSFIYNLNVKELLGKVAVLLGKVAVLLGKVVFLTKIDLAQ